MLLVQGFEDLERNDVENVANFVTVRSCFLLTASLVHIDYRLAENIEYFREYFTDAACYICIF
jgi:hypothetical protein